MNVRAAVGIAAGVVGVGAAVGLHAVMRNGASGNQTAATAEWNAWKGELDQEFPKVGSGDGLSKRPLFDDADQQRFEAFLQEHPAPSWIKVSHEDLRAISIDPFEPDSEERNWKGLIAGGLGIGGGLGVGITGAMMLERAGSAGSTLGLGLNVAGAALGIGTIAGLFFLPKADTLYDQIESTEWHVPSHWTD
jgi:hypothetical protein